MSGVVCKESSLSSNFFLCLLICNLVFILSILLQPITLTLDFKIILFLEVMLQFLKDEHFLLLRHVDPLVPEDVAQDPRQVAAEGNLEGGQG